MILLLIVGFILVVAGIVGCILPVIPGPPLSYAALILASVAYRWEPFSVSFLIIVGMVTLIVTLLDYLLPLFTAKKYGASKYGIWGSVFGMLIGIIFFPPFGLILGAFFGALIGELLFYKNMKKSLKAGFGIFMGTLFGIFLKLATSGMIGFYFIRAVLSHSLT